MEIVEVDPFDAQLLDPWHAVYLEAELAAGEGVAAPWQLEEVRALLQATVAKHWIRGYAGVVDGEVVSAGWIRTPLLDNVERAELMIQTAPAHRRRGHGTAMLEHLDRVARERGRSILVGETAWRYDAGASGAGEPGAEFARARGFELALGDVKRTLALPVDDAILDALTAEAAERHTGYRLRSFVGPVPDDLLDGWARMVASLAIEAPTGELEVEAESPDPALVRENEAVLARQGRTKYNTVALDPTGDLVAFTDIAATIHEPGRAYQWGTLVRRDARGRRLGLAVKVANLRLLQSEAPDIAVLTTYNAEVNRHMIGVNERLGFVPVARLGEFQKRP
ncbi:GNAT family N-acetyltransferase [Nocardioides sp. YIM 152315]|uniref:GNAT family N-acetyltransferase n=1 Tax=Nocardioides sp. YIM 152315 TaxID=3031760 RepID=UPI0023DB9182|nr:GNAT family N-acetyltransferase [Nocardioides sp. YIM 152315]MDF1603543.1 PE-PGRS family protein [Nocardioides sp. YIM 152315]